MLFDERVNFKPYEYVECEKFVNSINHSYWLVDEWNFIQDIHEFKSVLDDKEKLMVKRAMLAISQIEVAVKTFWSDLNRVFPKPEIAMVGATFAESEVRHERAYSKLLELTGFEKDFLTLNEEPCIKGRMAYLKKYKEFLNTGSKKDFLKSLVLFSLFVENISLFSQFFILASFKRYKNLLKDVCKVVTSTSKEEAVHAEFGIYLINQIKIEYPELWDGNTERSIIASAEKAYEAECKIIDWIMPNPTFLKRGLVKDFLKYRFNESLKKIGLPTLFSVHNKSEFKWYIEELTSTIEDDQFDGRPSNYTLKNKSITSEDLF